MVKHEKKHTDIQNFPDHNSKQVSLNSMFIHIYRFKGLSTLSKIL